MGYPYGDTYLEKIQKHKQECEDIETVYHALIVKAKRENGYSDVCEMSLKEQFAILGEAFEIQSEVLTGITDSYHFMWDVLGALLTPKEEQADGDN